MSDLGVGTPLPRDRQAATNSYDNTIVEFDTLMARVIGILQQETRPAVLVFVSDHGENLFDDERGIFMHAQNPPTRYDTHVPLLVWMNNNYRSSYARQANALQAHVHSKISHANMFPTVLDLAGVAWQGADPRQSFAAPQFTEGPRLVRSNGGQQVDFDTLR
jgi:glucan phosphoethanolaminetransferase (alkaline phosphatase superfamily)